MNVHFVKKELKMETISGEEDADYDDDETVEELKHPPHVKPDSNLPTLLLRRFLFAVVKNGYAIFEGTLVKYHNSVNPV